MGKARSDRQWLVARVTPGARPDRSRPWRPYHVHERIEPLEPGGIYELNVEIVPSCFAVSPGYRLGLSVRGKDYEYGGKLDEDGETYVYATRGTGGMTHNDPRGHLGLSDGPHPDVDPP